MTKPVPQDETQHTTHTGAEEKNLSTELSFSSDLSTCSLPVSPSSQALSDLYFFEMKAVRFDEIISLTTRFMTRQSWFKRSTRNTFITILY